MLRLSLGCSDCEDMYVAVQDLDEVTALVLIVDAELVHCDDEQERCEVCALMYHYPKHDWARCKGFFQ